LNETVPRGRRFSFCVAAAPHHRGHRAHRGIANHRSRHPFRPRCSAGCR